MIVYDPEKRASATELMSHPYVVSSEEQHSTQRPEVQNQHGTVSGTVTSQANFTAKDIDRNRRESDEGGSHKIRYEL
jgi:serine/threonine protein kinase